MNRQKQHNNLGQSNSLPVMCILPLQHGRFMYFWLVGFHNQMYTFHTLMNLLVTNLCYIHAQHWMIEAAWHDKNGAQQSVPWSVGRSLSDVTSLSHGSPNQPIRSIEACSWTFLCRLKIAKLQNVGDVCLALQQMFGECSWSFVKLREDFAKLP